MDATTQIPEEIVEDLDLLIQAGSYKSREEALQVAIKHLLKKLNQQQDRSTVHAEGTNLPRRSISW